jgi:hypothetical protein
MPANLAFKSDKRLGEGGTQTFIFYKYSFAILNVKGIHKHFCKFPQHQMY